MKHYFKFITLAIFTLILASCASKPTYYPDGLSDAEQLYLEKQYIEAAAAFNQEANSATGTQQTLLLLRTVIAYVKAEQLTQAVQLFHSIQLNENDAKQESLIRLTRAHIALAGRNAEDVLVQLNKPLAKDSSTLFLSEFHELRATAFSMQGERMTTAEEYIQQGNYLTDDESKLRNQQLIWQSLALLSERSLQQLQPAPAPDILSGWMELVRLWNWFDYQKNINLAQHYYAHQLIIGNVVIPTTQYIYLYLKAYATENKKMLLYLKILLCFSP